MDKNSIILLVLIILMSCGQSKPAAQVSNKASESKLEQKFQKAIEATRARKVSEAHKLYEEIIEDSPTYVQAYLMKGGLYYESQEWEKARSMFLEAIRIDDDHDPEVYYSLALTENKQKNYASAAQNLGTYLQLIDPDHRKYEKATELKESLDFKAKAVENPVNFEKEQLPFPINTDNSEYVPQFTADGKNLVFVRRTQQQEDLYISEYSPEGNFSMPRIIKEIATMENEGVHTISADGRTLIFTGCNRRDSYGSCDLYYSKKKSDGSWSLPSNLGRNINSISWDAQPSLSADGRTLYFSSARAGGIGGKDIYVTTRDNSGRWTSPRNISGAINTLGNDETPFIHADGRTLYFRSNGRLGMGGYDMYWSQFDPELGEWSVPENLGYPINTEADQGGLSIDLIGKNAYYSSNENGKDVDIFRFKLPEHLRPDLVTFIKGKVIDALSKTPLQCRITVVGYNKKDNWLIETDQKGEFIHALPVGENYGITVEKEGYVFYSDYLGLDSVYLATKPYEKIINLIPIREIEEREEVVVLNNIFFESGSATLMEKSQEEINRLSKLLKDNPTWKIEIIGHTDNVGSPADNMLLSEQRALAVVNALILKEINKSRLTYQGRGEEDPVASNDTSEGRQANRRTEFKIIQR